MRFKEIAKTIAGVVDPPSIRKGSPSPRLGEAEFKARFLSQFQDDAYLPLQDDLSRIAGAAWDAYSNERKSPHTRKAGPGATPTRITTFRSTGLQQGERSKTRSDYIMSRVARIASC